MFRKLGKWMLLPETEQWLFFQAFFLTGLVQAAILLFPFKLIAPCLGEQGVEFSDELEFAQRETSLRIGRVILKASSHTPWQSKCLVQAITGKILLRRAGIKNTLYLGIKKAVNGEMTAHAWLKSGELIITGERGWKGYISLTCFGENFNVVSSK